jgi:cytoskeletal protein CcmA (bactofilin family)
MAKRTTKKKTKPKPDHLVLSDEDFRWLSNEDTAGIWVLKNPVPIVTHHKTLVLEVNRTPIEIPGYCRFEVLNRPRGDNLLELYVDGDLTLGHIRGCSSRPLILRCRGTLNLQGMIIQHRLRLHAKTILAEDIVSVRSVRCETFEGAQSLRVTHGALVAASLRLNNDDLESVALQIDGYKQLTSELGRCMIQGGVVFGPTVRTDIDSLACDQLTCGELHCDELSVRGDATTAGIKADYIEVGGTLAANGRIRARALTTQSLAAGSVHIQEKLETLQDCWISTGRCAAGEFVIGGSLRAAGDIVATGDIRVGGHIDAGRFSQRRSRRFVIRCRELFRRDPPEIEIIETSKRSIGDVRYLRPVHLEGETS